MNSLTSPGERILVVECKAERSHRERNSRPCDDPSDRREAGGGGRMNGVRF